MLLRSSSTPIFNSWLSQTKGSPSESDQVHRLQRTQSLSLATSFHPSPPPSDDPAKKIAQNLPESETTNPRKKIRVPQSCKIQRQEKSKENGITLRDQELRPTLDSSTASAQRVLLSSGLGGQMANDEGCNVRRDECVLQTLVVGGGMGSSGGRICGGGGGGKGSDGGGGGHDDRSGFFENNHHHGSNSTDAYYRKMIEANPGNALLLGNYAKFLKEVHGDLAKAEEFCARAILADPNDGNILSLYADIIWHLQKDAQRAETYFDQAVKTSPDDCYLLASYARFLWDTDVDEEDDKADHYGTEGESRPSPPSFSHGVPHHSPLTTAS